MHGLSLKIYLRTNFDLSSAERKLFLYKLLFSLGAFFYRATQKFGAQHGL